METKNEHKNRMIVIFFAKIDKKRIKFDIKIKKYTKWKTKNLNAPAPTV